MKKMRLWYTCRNQKKVESVLNAHYTRQLDTAVVVSGTAAKPSFSEGHWFGSYQ